MYLLSAAVNSVMHMPEDGGSERNEQRSVSGLLEATCRARQPWTCLTTWSHDSSGQSSHDHGRRLLVLSPFSSARA